MQQLSQFGIDGLILGLLLVFAVLGFIRPLVKLFFLIIALAVGAVAAIWAYNNGFAVSKVLVEKPEPWMSMAVAAIAFFGAFFFARIILGFLHGGSKETGIFHKFGFGIPGAILSLGVGSLIFYGALTGVRYAGTMAEMERLKDYASDNFEGPEAEPILAKLKNWIDRSRMGQFHQKFDVINDPAQATLAKLAIVQEKSDALEQTDAEAILDVIPVSQEEALQSSIREGDFSALLKNDQLRDASLEAANRDRLLRLNIEKALGLED
ncbi:MAG: CvpA family protein [Akkermansiaceae bacterium]